MKTTLKLRKELVLRTFYPDFSPLKTHTAVDAISLYFSPSRMGRKCEDLFFGRGSLRQQNVAVAAEPTPLEDPETGKKGKHCRYFKTKVLEGQGAKYLQLYLDKFCYKLNRRYFGDMLFDRLTVAIESNYWHDNR